ncbi:RICIN domain-containing protein [Streptomyces sp. NPDC001493]
MRLPFTRPTAARPGEAASSASRPRPVRRRPASGRVTPLGTAIVLLLAFFAALAPSSASAADTTRIEIVNAGTKLRADVMWGSTSSLTGVFLWPDNTSASQEFDLLDSGNGFFRIRARHSGQCLMLDWRAGTYSDGTKVLQYPACDAGYAPAEWSVQMIRADNCTGLCFGVWYMLIKNRATGRCLDAEAPSGHPVQEAVLQQWTCITAYTDWNAWNQMWEYSDPDPIVIP